MSNEEIYKSLKRLYKEAKSLQQGNEYTVLRARRLSQEAKELLNKWKPEQNPEKFKELKARCVHHLDKAIANADLYFKNFDQMSRQLRSGSPVDWIDSVREAEGGLEIFIYLLPEIGP